MENKFDLYLFKSKEDFFLIKPEGIETKYKFYPFSDIQLWMVNLADNELLIASLNQNIVLIAHDNNEIKQTITKHCQNRTSLEPTYNSSGEVNKEIIKTRIAEFTVEKTKYFFKYGYVLITYFHYDRWYFELIDSTGNVVFSGKSQCGFTFGSDSIDLITMGNFTKSGELPQEIKKLKDEVKEKSQTSAFVGFIIISLVIMLIFFLIK